MKEHSTPEAREKTKRRFAVREAEHVERCAERARRRAAPPTFDDFDAGERQREGRERREVPSGFR